MTVLSKPFAPVLTESSNDFPAINEGQKNKGMFCMYQMVPTDAAQTGTNEETPLHGQLNGGNPNTAGPTDGAEENEAVGMDAKETDYASIDYSLLKNRAPEEEEKEPTSTDYAEIKRDKRRDEKERAVLRDGDDQIETQDQMEGEEELYSNSQELKF